MKSCSLGQLAALLSRSHIAIAGPPGSGKSWLATALSEQTGAPVIPLDGYHIPRKNLDQWGLKYRGHYKTFDFKKFSKNLKNFLQTGEGSFPIFSHAQKDPQENAIVVLKGQNVIFQGLYLFTPLVQHQFQIRVWVHAPAQLRRKRVVQRHLQAGIESSREKSEQRYDQNDRPNGQFVEAAVLEQKVADGTNLASSRVSR